MRSTTTACLRSLLTATILFGLSRTVGAAPAPPSLEIEWQHCRTQFSSPSAAAADKNYKGGIAENGNQLTPPTIPGVTTVTVRQAECLMERMGRELVVAGTYASGDAVAYSISLRHAGSTRPTFSDSERAQLAEHIAARLGSRKERPILVYCHHESCMLSHNAAIRLVQAGYTNVFWMREGIKGWKAAGLLIGQMDADAPAMGKLSDDAPRREYQSIGYLDYPIPAWTFARDGDRLTINDKQYRTGRLCLAMSKDLQNKKDEEAAKSGADLYLWQATLYKMAQVDPAVDNDVVVRRKMHAFWGNYGARLECSYNGPFVKGSLLKHALFNGNRAFLDLYLHQWRLPVNLVDHTDGFTALDALINAENMGDSFRGKYHSEYNKLRWLGAMTRRDAEAAGVIPTERQLQANYIKEYEALSGRGNPHASHHLSWIYRQGRHVDVNDAQASRWHDVAERQAIQNKDYAFMTDIGRAYMRFETTPGAREFKPMRPENDQLAVQWFKRAAEGKHRGGMFYYGRALVYGWGGQKDEEAGLRWLTEAYRANEDLAAIHMTNVFARRGDIQNAAIHGRSVHPLAYDNKNIGFLRDMGMSIRDYFKKNSLSWCGPRGFGQEPRAASECLPGE